ncbi:MAG: pro-sigmaK processing inhibitor BofA family protein [Limnochordales bacterium]|nr:pro-sigmaK processing inhibitor BofA family protein [Limnochordales bacterium]
MELHVVVAYIVGVLLLYLLARVLLLPLRVLLRLIYNALLGAALLALVNLAGTYVAGVYLPINPVTALVAGFLGLPGVVLLIALQHLLL